MASIFKLPSDVVARGSGMPILTPRNAHLAGRHRRVNYAECGRQRAGFGGAKSARRWAGPVAPRASSVASLPIAAEDCTECSVVLRTTKGCGLGVSRYPDLAYNAEGGGGSGKAVKLSDGRWRVQFDAAELHIPDVCYRTTSLLGVPMPPPIRIEIVPDTLEGTVDRDTGKMELRFQSRFYFSASRFYKPPPLVVDTLLTTETTHGEFRGGTGSRVDADGNCRLVGVGRLAPTGDFLMDRVLMLPSDCYASMAAKFTFAS